MRREPAINHLLNRPQEKQRDMKDRRNIVRLKMSEQERDVEEMWGRRAKERRTETKCILARKLTKQNKAAKDRLQ